MAKKMISLATGTPLPNMELTPINQQSATESKKIKLIFIFKSPCSACNANLTAWKRFTQYFGEKIEILGIILDGRMEAQRLIDEESVNFQLYVPENIESFKEKMHIRLNMAQTIITSDNKVMSIRIGTLKYTDIERIIKTIKDTLKGT
jgi:peroxiredoxin